MVATTGYGQVRAAKVALATNIFPNLVKRARLYVVPVWDYVLMTEPLTAAQLDDIGWRGRQGIGDSANQFHYYRLSADNRILWGGYDAIYNFGNGMERRHEHRPETYTKLAGSLLRHVPAARRHSVQPCLGWCHRHVDPILRLLGAGLRRKGRLCHGLHRPRRGRDPFRGPGDARPARRGSEPSGPTCSSSGASRHRSRPSPFGTPGSNSRGGRSTGQTEVDGRRNVWLRSLDRLGLGFDS